MSSTNCQPEAMTGVFEADLQQALDELRQRLLADAAAVVAGGALSGGSRRRWRGLVLRLAAASKASRATRSRAGA
jgi:hypothetical protein